MKKSILLILPLAITVFGCNKKEIAITPKMVYPDVAEAINPTILTDINGVKIYNGGFGSAMVQDSKDSFFYMLTDRGPNIDGTIANQKVFATLQITLFN